MWVLQNNQHPDLYWNFAEFAWVPLEEATQYDEAEAKQLEDRNCTAKPYWVCD